MFTCWVDILKVLMILWDYVYSLVKVMKWYFEKRSDKNIFLEDTFNLQNIRLGIFRSLVKVW